MLVKWVLKNLKPGPRPLTAAIYKTSVNASGYGNIVSIEHQNTSVVSKKKKRKRKKAIYFVL